MLALCEELLEFLNLSSLRALELPRRLLRGLVLQRQLFELPHRCSLLPRFIVLLLERQLAEALELAEQLRALRLALRLPLKSLQIRRLLHQAHVLVYPGRLRLRLRLGRRESCPGLLVRRKPPALLLMRRLLVCTLLLVLGRLHALLRLELTARMLSISAALRPRARETIPRLVRYAWVVGGGRLGLQPHVAHAQQLDLVLFGLQTRRARTREAALRFYQPFTRCLSGEGRRR